MRYLLTLLLFVSCVSWCGAQICTPATRCAVTGATDYAVSGAAPAGYETGSQGRNMVFTFDVENGIYQVDLRFIEHEMKRTGARQMRVWVNDSKVLENFEIYARGGYRTPVVRGFMVPVADGTLRIQIQSQQTRPAIINRIALSRMSRVFWLSGPRIDE